MNDDWPEFPGCTFEIWGVDGSLLKFTSRSVLAKRVVSTGIIAFDVEITIDGGTHPLVATFTIADYSGLRTFREQVDAICKGGDKSASMSDGSTTIWVRRHHFGVRERLLVEGEWHLNHAIATKPPLDRTAIANYVTLESHPAISGRFTFVTACVDPPYLETAVSQMDAILCALEAEGFKP
jgi:hypothetical protein